MPDEHVPRDAIPPPPPVGHRSGHFQPEASGAYASWRVIIITVLTVLGTGTGYTGWRFVTEAQVDEKIARHTEAVEKNRHELKASVTKNTKAIVQVTAKVESVQEVQHMDYSLREARRVVDERIKCGRYDRGCQQRRDDETERVRRLNMARLKKGKAPCPDLECR